MTKSWEEEWTYRPEYQHVQTPEGCDITIPHEGQLLDSDEVERLILAAAAPDMARALMKIEWVLLPDDRYGPRCPCCLGLEWRDGEPRTGHEEHCSLNAALRKAGLGDRHG